LCSCLFYPALPSDGSPHASEWSWLGAQLKHDGYRLQNSCWTADGQFNKSVQIVAFNTTENWSRDVTANIAIKLLEESQQGRFVSEAARKLIERITGEQFTVSA
jgi:hypothetical protein